jgi:hypothetical protein
MAERGSRRAHRLLLHAPAGRRARAHLVGLDAQAVETSKTEATSPIVAAAYPELAAELDAERARQREAKLASTHVVVCESTNRPWTADYFRHVFREIGGRAGLPAELQFRDLRATGLTEMADVEVSILDMSTHSANATVQMARHYSRKTPEQFQRAAAKRLARTRKP